MIRAFLLAVAIAFAICEIAYPVDPGDNAEAPAAPVIYFFHSTDCGPCRQWERRDLAAWERVGWRVERVIELTLRPVPWFRVYDTDGVTFDVVGPLTGDNFRAAKTRAVQQPKPKRKWLD
jgi:hypothetical protein